MTRPVPPPAIPAEFRGLARVFREDVLAADRRVDAALPAIVEPLARRLHKKPTLRPELLIETARSWEARISDEFTCRVPPVRAGKRAFTLGELRVCSGLWRTDRWNAPSWAPGVSLVWTVLRVEDGKLDLHVRPVVHLLQHAIARRFQRGDGRTARDVIRDLRVLPPPRCEGDAAVDVPYGRWVGVWQTVRDDYVDRSITLFNCRTFLN